MAWRLGGARCLGPDRVLSRGCLLLLTRGLGPSEEGWEPTWTVKPTPAGRPWHLAGQDEYAEPLPPVGSGSLTELALPSSMQNGVLGDAFPIMKMRTSGAKG